MQEPGEPRLPRPENPKFKPANALESRMLLAASNPSRIDELFNPDDKNIPRFVMTDIKDINDQDFSLYNNSSTNERLKEASVKPEELDQKIQEWADSTVNRIQKSEYKEKLRKIFGDPDKITAETMKQFYSQNFTGDNKESDIKSFVKFVIEQYNRPDLKDTTHAKDVNVIALNNDFAAIEWFSHVFGTNSAEVVTQLLDAEVRSAGFQKEPWSEDKKRGFSDFPAIGSEYINDISKDSKDERLLRFLQQNRYTPQFEPATAEPAEPANTPSTEPLETTTVNQILWNSVPKPQQPLKIREGSFEQNQLGRVKNAEIHLLWGTKKHPLVTENKWADGRREKVRIMNPERPYHIPAMIYLDDDITQEQRTLIQQNLPKIFKQLGVPQQLVVFSDESGSKFTSTQLQRARNGEQRQYDVDNMMTKMRTDPNQIEKPHHSIVFTNKDLFSQDTNFVVGSALPDLGTIISLTRIWNGIKDSTLRNEVIKTEIAHELGHVYNLPSRRRGPDKIEQSLGAHCKNDGCCMKQGLTVPADFITITQNRLQKLHDQFYCNDCHIDLSVKFKEPLASSLLDKQQTPFKRKPTILGNPQPESASSTNPNLRINLPSTGLKLESINLPNSQDLANSYWASLDEKTAQSIRKTLEANLQMRAKLNKPIIFDYRPLGLTEKHKEIFAVYTQLADELNLEIGPFLYDKEKLTVTANVKEKKDKVPADTL